MPQDLPANPNVRQEIQPLPRSMPGMGHVRSSLPTWTTMSDLVKLCPGCGKSVVWPFTQDPFAALEAAKQGKPLQLYKVSDDEAKVLRSMFADIENMFSVGTRINTLRTDSGTLWHHPCYVLAEMVEFQKRMQKVHDILFKWVVKRCVDERWWNAKPFYWNPPPERYVLGVDPAGKSPSEVVREALDEMEDAKHKTVIKGICENCGRPDDLMFSEFNQQWQCAECFGNGPCRIEETS